MNPQLAREFARELERAAYVCAGCAFYGPWWFLPLAAGNWLVSIGFLFYAIRKQSPGP